MAGWGLSCKSQLAVRLCLLYRDYHGGGPPRHPARRDGLVDQWQNISNLNDT